jgi:hypothetical protein
VEKFNAETQSALKIAKRRETSKLEAKIEVKEQRPSEAQDKHGRLCHEEI